MREAYYIISVAQHIMMNSQPYNKSKKRNKLIFITCALLFQNSNLPGLFLLSLWLSFNGSERIKANYLWEIRFNFKTFVEYENDFFIAHQISVFWFNTNCFVR